MNLSTAVFLLPESKARAIMVTYEAQENAQRTMFKTFDQNIKVDDYVVVPTDTRHKLTVCKVVEVDVDVDFDSSTQVAWLVGRVDMADMLQIKEQETKILEAIKAAEKNRKRKELQKSMADLIADGGGDIKLLTISATATDETKAA